MASLSAAGYLSILTAVHVPTRDNAIVNRLNKTKVEKEVDHEADRQARLKEEGRRKKAEAIERASAFITRSFLTNPHRRAKKRSKNKRGRHRRSSAATRACTARTCSNSTSEITKVTMISCKL